MYKFKVKAVIFDMDGVITNTMPAHFRAWKKIFKREGLNATKCEIYLREGQPGNITIKEIFREHGLPFDVRKTKPILAKKEKLFKKIVRTRFIPGARSLLHFLKNRGFQLALVTGTSRHEVRRILPKHVFNLFSVTVTGDEVKRGKPNPEPYLVALKKLNMKPREVVVIENAPFGIRSAKRAHLTCLALETSLPGRQAGLPKTYLKDADFVFSSFKNLRVSVAFV